MSEYKELERKFEQLGYEIVYDDGVPLIVTDGRGSLLEKETSEMYVTLVQVKRIPTRYDPITLVNRLIC